MTGGPGPGDAMASGAMTGGPGPGGAMTGGAGSDPRVAYVLGTASGGTALHAGMLAEGGRQAGFPVLALGPAGSRTAFTAGAASLPGAAGDSIPFHVVDISDRPRPGRDLIALLRLRGLLRRAGPDVVHAHGLRAGAFAALAALAVLPGARARRPALVVTVHNASPAGRLPRLVYGGLELICARRARVVLCVSPDLVLRMRRRGAAGAMLTDVPAPAGPPPSAQAVAQARADLGGTARPCVLAVGRLAGQKGFDTLLAAAVRWRDRPAVPRLAIAGEGPLRGELAETARRTGVDLVMLGLRDDVPALLAAADVVVVPSRWEGQPFIVQEALRAGRPIVASRAGGIPRLTGTDAAVLVPPGDERQLGAAVIAVLEDPALAARLAAAARDRAADLPSVRDAVAVSLAMYCRLAAGK